MEEHLEVTYLLTVHPWVDWTHQGTWGHGHPVEDLLRVGYRQEGKTERRERQDTLAPGLLWAVRWVLGHLSRGHLALAYLKEDRWKL